MKAYEVFKHPEKGYQGRQARFFLAGLFFYSHWLSRVFSKQLWMQGIVLLICIGSQSETSSQRPSQENPFFRAIVILISCNRWLASRETHGAARIWSVAAWQFLARSMRVTNRCRGQNHNGRAENHPQLN